MKTVERRMVVVGHRGASGYEPENTFASFDLAVQQGADMVELDVHLTRDGVPVVIHDDTLGRTTGETGKVRERSLAQIRNLNAAVNNPNHPYEPVPTLEEVVDKYHNKVGLMVEIKYGSSFYQDIEEKVVSILEKYGAVIDCEIISFDFDCVRKVKSIRRDISTGIIFIGRIHDFIPLAEQIGCSALHPSYEYISAKDIVETRKRTTLAVYAWTLNDPEGIRYQCEVTRPDGIVTDYPDVALREVRRL